MMLTFLLTIFALYLLATLCRRGQPRLQQLQGWAYAHRGLHGNGLPENSMAASGPLWMPVTALSWMCTCWPTAIWR